LSGDKCPARADEAEVIKPGLASFMINPLDQEATYDLNKVGHNAARGLSPNIYSRAPDRGRAAREWHAASAFSPAAT
jgi:hypothetical protein